MSQIIIKPQNRPPKDLRRRAGDRDRGTLAAEAGRAFCGRVRASCARPVSVAMPLQKDRVGPDWGAHIPSPQWLRGGNGENFPENESRQKKTLANGEKI